MVNFTPEDLSAWSGGEWTRNPNSSIREFCIDSRLACKDSLFVALRANRDGHDFLSKAVAKGANAGLVDHHLEILDCPQLVVEDTLVSFQQIAKRHRQNFMGQIVGVTGSCGKTTTKEILKVLLPGSYCTKGNFNNHIGVPLTLTKISPEVHDFAVVEAGINTVGEMKGLTEMIHPDISVITSIGHSHLEGLGDIENVAKEKVNLWMLGKESCLGIFPEELLQFHAFDRAVREKPFITVKNEKIRETELKQNQVAYEISTETKECGHSQKLSIKRCGCPPLVVSIPHTSAGTVRNMVLASIAAWKLGVSDEEICERLPQYRASGLRGSCLVGRGCSYVLDCYNANPSSMLDSINFFYEKFSNDEKLLVLGGMNELGEKSSELHYETGRSISLFPTDRVILIGENSLQFANGMLENGASEEQISILSDLECARPVIEEFKGVVLLKGSRSYHLEELIPSWAVEEIEPMKIAC